VCQLVLSVEGASLLWICEFPGGGGIDKVFFGGFLRGWVAIFLRGSSGYRSRVGCLRGVAAFGFAGLAEGGEAFEDFGDTGAAGGAEVLGELVEGSGMGWICSVVRAGASIGGEDGVVEFIVELAQADHHASVVDALLIRFLEAAAGSPFHVAIKTLEDGQHLLQSRSDFRHFFARGFSHLNLHCS